MGSTSEKKILVVDDEPDVRIFLSTCLEDAGFIVESAQDGHEALDKLEEFNPDLMTLDLFMPGLSGIKVIRKLRKISKWAKLPIVVITAHAHDELGEDQIKGFNAMTSGLKPRITMEKPISPKNLVKTICEILEVEETAIPDKESLLDPDREKLIKLIKQTDTQTLAKIRNAIKS